MGRTEVVNKFEILLSERPHFHAHYDEQGRILQSNVACHQISRAVLDWFVENLDANEKTIETGCGYSTVAFLILGTEHVVISPFKEEHDAIKEWCQRNGIATERTQFVAKRSQDVLPSLRNGPQLDLALVDGDHSFPVPFLDWYYLADRVKKGGYVVVDDTQLMTGTILREFLRTEKGRWSLVTEIGTTAIVRKEIEGSVFGSWHGLQPFCVERKRGLMRRARRKLARLLAHPEDAIWRR